MKKIKFRGRAIQDYNGKAITEKKFVYGNVWTNEDNSYVIIGEYKDAKGLSNHYVVDPDSVTQFVGYDADDKEVYEDDILVDKDGHEWRVHDVPQVEMLCGGVYEGLYNEKSAFKLKERGENA